MANAHPIPALKASITGVGHRARAVTASRTGWLSLDAVVLLALFPPFFLKSLEFRPDNLWTLLWIAALIGLMNGWRVEFHFEMWGVGDKIYKEPPAPDGGLVTLPETPGLGLEPRWDALQEFEET